MSDPTVEPEDVRHVAELARIDLSEAEIEAFREEFEAILEYFERLESVPAVDATETDRNVLRPDEPRPSLSQEAALENAEETEDGYIKGPRVS